MFSEQVHLCKVMFGKYCRDRVNDTTNGRALTLHYSYHFINLLLNSLCPILVVACRHDSVGFANKDTFLGAMGMSMVGEKWNCGLLEADPLAPEICPGISSLCCAHVAQVAAQYGASKVAGIALSF